MKYNLSQFLRHTIAGLFTISLIVAGLTFGPQLHRQYLSHDLKSKVIELSDLNKRGGGTGFYVEAASGKTVIVTNAHVCAGAKALLQAEEIDGKWEFTRTKVIKENPYVDLCALEAIDEEIEGLEVARRVDSFEDSYVFGYPAGYEFFSKGMVQKEVIVKEVQYNVSPIECPGEFRDFRTMQPRNMMELVQILSLLSKKIYTGCRADNKLLMVSNSAYPGISGSPVVNKFGNVMGVVARYTPTILAGMMVQRFAVRDFLSDL